MDNLEITETIFDEDSFEIVDTDAVDKENTKTNILDKKPRSSKNKKETEMSVLDQEKMFISILEGKDKIHEIKLSNGFIVKMRQPTNLEVTKYRNEGNVALYEDHPDVYQEAYEAGRKGEAYINPILESYTSYGFLVATMDLIKPTFDGFGTEVTSDQIYDFITNVPEIDRERMFAKYLEISGLLTNNVQENVESFRKVSKGKRVISSADEGKK